MVQQQVVRVGSLLSFYIIYYIIILYNIYIIIINKEDNIGNGVFVVLVTEN